MKQLTVRFLLVGLIAFLFGVGGNQLIKEGFHWRFLSYAIGDIWSVDKSLFMSVDSVFAVFLNDSSDFIDIRTRMDYQVDHIPGAVLFPYESFISHPDDLNEFVQHHSCIIYGDRTMARKACRVARHLKRCGVNRVAVLKQGYGAWLDMHFPIESQGES